MRRYVVFGSILFLLASASRGWTVAANPVVVELFESQGCSSCPPSERVMENLHRTFGPDVILLTFHVDYWDYLGWKDTFSDNRYTARQKQYGQAFNQNSIYTPEMIVQGEVGFVGSEWQEAKTEVEQRRPLSRSPFHLTVKTDPLGGTHLSIDLPPALAHQARNAVAVVYENAPPVHVLRGENAGATMSGEYAVRMLVPLHLSAEGHSSVVIPIDPSWHQAGVAVLVRGGMPKILAAEAAPL